MERYLPPSANGYCLPYTNQTGTWFLTAAWPAPFFVLFPCDEGRPLFVHCEDAAHKDAIARIGGKAFDSAFMPLTPLTSR